MAHDDIPEDKEESYECPTGCGGNVTKIGNVWQCTKCAWSAPDSEEDGR